LPIRRSASKLAGSFGGIDPVFATMLPAAPMNAPGQANRRTFLYVLTGAVGAAGVTAAFWPLVDHMNPDAAVRAAGDIVSLDLADLQPAAQRTTFWRRVPIFVANRTAAMLDAMRDRAFAARLTDADSQARQQPPYARNWHRSIDPRYAVLVGICTACGCVPRFVADVIPDAMTGGYICPCCASHYDPAGRAYAGIARFNLPVPPYRIDAPSRLMLGKNPPGELFTLDAVERI
jgi:ubiquinol-cytochrome c reductase iron-sulfur subunit